MSFGEYVGTGTPPEIALAWDSHVLVVTCGDDNSIRIDMASFAPTTMVFTEEPRAVYRVPVSVRISGFKMRVTAKRGVFGGCTSVPLDRKIEVLADVTNTSVSKKCSTQVPIFERDVVAEYHTATNMVRVFIDNPHVIKGPEFEIPVAPVVTSVPYLKRKWWSVSTWTVDNVNRSPYNSDVKWWTARLPASVAEISVLIQRPLSAFGTEHLRLQSERFSQLVGNVWAVVRKDGDQGLTSAATASAMRAGAYDAKVRELQDAMRDVNDRERTREALLVFRGLPVSAIQYDEHGPFVRDNSFMSTTLRASIAQRFAGANGIVVGIVVPVGTPVAIVDKWLQVVLPPGTLRFVGPHVQCTDDRLPHTFFPARYVFAAATNLNGREQTGQ